MQIDYKKAQALCTAAEFDLLTGTKPPALAKLAPAALKRQIARTRKLADKWRRQSRKQGASQEGSAARSVEKHELFTVALARYEKKLAKLTAPSPAKPAPAKKATVRKTAAKKVAVKKAAKIPALAKASRKVDPRMDMAGKAERKAIGTNLRISASGLNSRIRGHVSASGRRNQAARSSRKRS